jgi:hypothetical protein
LRPVSFKKLKSSFVTKDEMKVCQLGRTKDPTKNVPNPANTVF